MHRFDHIASSYSSNCKGTIKVDCFQYKLTNHDSL